MHIDRGLTLLRLPVLFVIKHSGAINVIEQPMELQNSQANLMKKISLYLSLTCLLLAETIYAQVLGPPGWVKDFKTGCQIWDAEGVNPKQSISWSGKCTQGKIQGYGVVQWYENGQPIDFKFEGNFVDGRSVGKMKIASSATTYIGEVTNNLPNGQGTTSWSNGMVFTGQHVNGKITGQGVLRQPNGTSYRGEFLNGQKHGFGMVTYASGATYTGSFLYDKINGYGTMTFSDGGMYIGSFKDEHFDGPGFLSGPGGIVMSEGIYENGKLVKILSVTSTLMNSMPRYTPQPAAPNIPPVLNCITQNRGAVTYTHCY